MNPIRIPRTRLKRSLCLLLALVLLSGLVPAPAQGADNETIKLTDCDFTGTSYHSAQLGEASIHTMQFDYNGGATGFCGDHGKGMGRSLIGQTWGSPTAITDPTVKMLLAYYYAHTLGIFTDAAVAAGVDHVWGEEYTNYMNAWIQAVIWRSQEGSLRNPVEDCAEELMWVYNCLRNENNTSIDDCTAGSTISFRQSTQYIFDLGTATWGSADAYQYRFTGAGSSAHPADQVQSVIVGSVQTSSVHGPESYSLTVKKVDASNPSLGLSGASFHVEKQGSSMSWDVVTGADGTYTLRDLTAGTYAVTETGAPSGYTIDNAGPDYVVLPSDGSSSVTKVFSDSPHITASGSIRKVDADDPSKGLAGATIAIQGVDNNFYGEYQTGAGGALQGLEWSSLLPGSYRAWEVSAPEGYSLNPGDVKTFRISAETPEVRLVFENDAKVKVQLVKLDDADRPLPGAVFHIFKDGQIIGTRETDASGRITVTNVETGMYAFVEVSAPTGYAKLDEPVCVYVDQEAIQGGGLITVTATDRKLPDLTIEKKDGATGAAIPGTVFAIRGIHTGYQQDVTTGADGKATLTGIPVDYYEVTEKNVPAPYTLSDERTQTVWLGAGEHPTLVFNNLEEPKLSILKLDAETSTPIPGVVFNVQGIDVDYEADWTTGDDGKYTAQITPGSYRITEVSVPAPYSLSANNVRTVALTAGAERELVFENLKNPLLNLVKIDALDGRVIPDTVFAVQGVDNSYASQWTTGTDGTISERVEPGTYRVTEVSVPAPYYLPENEADRVQTISLRAGDIRSLVFKDYRTPTLTIYKLDAVGGAPVEGAQFHVTYTSNGTASDAPASYDFGTLYTNADGEIPLHETGTRLYPGLYTVTETAPPPGFQMRQPTTQTVIINGSESRSLTFYNVPLNAIIVEKYDSVTGLAVPGATFRLRYLSGTSGTDGTVIGTKTTGESGSAIWTGLEAGTYIVEEISAPSGYNITRSTQTVYLAANGEQSVITVSFDNTPDGGLLVRKVDAKTGLPLAGIEFLITDSRGAFLGTSNGRFVTDASGMIAIDGVTPGTTLVVRETRTLPGYILDTTPQTAVILEGRTTTLTFRNEPKGTIIVYKKDAVTGAALEGVQFRITTASGEAVDSADGMLSTSGVYFTDSNGQIVLAGLNPDTYVVTETAAISGYVLNATPHMVVVGAGDTQTLTITNRPRGELLVLKLDRTTRLPLSNAQFRIVPANDALLLDNEGLTAANHLYTTDEDGQIRLSSLTPGAYIVTEMTAPEGYALDAEAQTVVVQSGRSQTLTFYDSALAVLQILKRDAVSHQPLAEAEFTVTTADGTRLGENNGIYTTGEDGTATVTGLQPNSAVIVSETTSPAGYVLNATPRSIIVRSGSVNSLVFNDEPTTTLLVHKYVTGTRNEPLSGVEFKVTNSRGEAQGMNNGIYTTDTNGDFMVTGLDPGLTITVRETKTVDGYVLDGTPQSIQILAGDMQELTFRNQRKGSLLVRKLAEDTGLPLAGAEFHIAYADGRPVETNNGRTSTNGRYVTDSRGEIVINDVTGVIVVTETATVDGYAINPSARSQTVVVNPEDAQTLTFTNPRLQTLTLTKYVTGTTTPIQGVTYLLTDGDGAAIGSANGEYTTDSRGQIVVENLIPGTTVTAREIRVPDEYVLDGTPHTIRIRSGEAQSLMLYNSRKGSLTIRKVDSATGEALPGAQFRVTTATGDAVTGTTGSTGSGGIFTTDRNGEITLNRLQPGTYTVREVQAPDGYVPDDQPRTVVLNADEAQSVTFANAPKGSLVLVKRDAVTGAPLPGAEFQVTTAAGTLVANNGGHTSSNGLYVTDEAGQITLTKLDPGVYVVTEITAPEGYHLSADAQTVEVTADDVQTLRFADEPLAALTIRKRDAVTGAALSGAVFSVKDSEGRTIGASDGLFTTGADGSATVTGLIPGTSVVVTETKAPDGYVLNDHSQTIQIRSGAANSVTFEDQPTATLIIRKIAADTGDPLSGVSFKVIDGSGANIGPDDGIFTTDHSGEIHIPNLTPGTTVQAREIEAAPGYVLDPIPQDVELLAGQAHTLTFRDHRRGTLVIRKLDSATNQPLAGVTFKITTASGAFLPDQEGLISGSGLYRTDAAGEIILTGIVGTLVVTETETIPGYVMDETTRSQTVVVHPADTQTLTFYNAPKQSLTVWKYASGTTTPLRGAEFLVTDSTGAALGSSNGVYVTDENGRFVVTDLEPGVTVTGLCPGRDAQVHRHCQRRGPEPHLPQQPQRNPDPRQAGQPNGPAPPRRGLSGADRLRPVRIRRGGNAFLQRTLYL